MKTNAGTIMCYEVNHEHAKVIRGLEVPHELLAALPEIMSEQEYFDYFEHTFTVCDLDKEVSSTKRIEMVSNLQNFRIARDFGYPVYLQVCDAIRKGYYLSEKRDGKFVKHEGSTTAFALIGPSGVGKTTALTKALQSLPQKITHYGKDFKFNQIVYIKVDCPPTGSMKSFYDACMLELEKAMDCEIPDKKRCKTVDDKARLFKKLALRWNLGLLVIDEIQNLLVKKSDNLLNQFLNLSNELKVPIVYVGTEKIIEYFQDADFFSKRRLGCELYAKPYKQDVEWDNMLDKMWQYQWMQEYVPLTRELNDVFFHESGGIIDRVICLYEQAQKLAISTGKDTVTRFNKTFISHVSKSLFPLSRDGLNRIAKADPQDKAIFEQDLQHTARNAMYILNETNNMSEEIRKNGVTVMEHHTEQQRDKVLAELQNHVLVSIMKNRNMFPFAIKREDIVSSFNAYVKGKHTDKLVEEKITQSIIKEFMEREFTTATETESNPKIDLSEINFPILEGAI